MSSSNESPYSIYLRFHTGLAEGREMGSKDFNFDISDSTFGLLHIPFNEEQTVAATIAIQDHAAKAPARIKSKLLAEITRILK